MSLMDHQDRVEADREMEFMRDLPKHNALFHRNLKCRILIKIEGRIYETSIQEIAMDGMYVRLNTDKIWGRDFGWVTGRFLKEHWVCTILEQ